MNIVLAIDYLDPKFQIWARLKCAPIFMKFDAQKKSNMLIMNILLEIDDLDPQLQI